MTLPAKPAPQRETPGPARDHTRRTDEFEDALGPAKALAAGLDMIQAALDSRRRGYVCRSCLGVTDAALAYLRDGEWRCDGCGETWPKPAEFRALIAGEGNRG